MPTEQPLDRRKEDAIRQAQEMRSRAQPAPRQDRRRQPGQRGPRLEAAPPPPPEPEPIPPETEPTPPPPEEAPPADSPLAALFQDPERSLLLILLLLLSDGDRNQELVFALLYLLI